MKLIGIIGAMEVEVASLKEMMTDVTIRTKASMEFNHGYLNGKEVVVVRSGRGTSCPDQLAKALEQAIQK